MTYDYDSPLDNGARDDEQDELQEDPSDIRQDVEAWQAGSTKLTAEQGGYQGPQDAPFACSNCVYFDQDGQPCEKISDPVEGGGCCYAFKNEKGQGLPSDHPLAARQSAQKDAARYAVMSAANANAAQ